jgi:hypothetical protein
MTPTDGSPIRPATVTHGNPNLGLTFDELVWMVTRAVIDAGLISNIFLDNNGQPYAVIADD